MGRFQTICQSLKPPESSTTRRGNWKKTTGPLLKAIAAEKEAHKKKDEAEKTVQTLTEEVQKDTINVQNGVYETTQAEAAVAKAEDTEKKDQEEVKKTEDALLKENLEQEKTNRAAAALNTNISHAEEVEKAAERKEQRVDEEIQK